MSKLEKLIEEFSSLRESFHNYTHKGEVKKETLNDFQEKFVKLKADFTYWKSKLVSNWVRFDDKAATAIKYRIAVAISRGEFIDDGQIEPMPKCVLSQAEKLAAGCQKYKKFVDQRAFNKESITNISDIREDCNSYITLIINMIR